MTTIFSISKYPVKSITCLLFYFLTFSILKLIYLLKIIKFLPRISLKKKNFKIIQVLRRILLFIHLINNYLKLIEIKTAELLLHEQDRNSKTPRRRRRNYENVMKVQIESFPINKKKEIKITLVNKVKKKISYSFIKIISFLNKKFSFLDLLKYF